MHGLGDSSEGFLDFFYTKGENILPNKVLINQYWELLLEYKSYLAQRT